MSKSVANPLRDKDSRPAASVAFFMGNHHDPRNGIRREPAAAPSTVEGTVTLVSVGDLGESVGVSTATPSYKGHRYPVEIINHCIWLYFRFPLSFREVEELMLARGVAVSYETIRRWCAKFGRA